MHHKWNCLYICREWWRVGLKSNTKEDSEKWSYTQVPRTLSHLQVFQTFCYGSWPEDLTHTWKQSHVTLLQFQFPHHMMYSWPWSTHNWCQWYYKMGTWMGKNLGKWNLWADRFGNVVVCSRVKKRQTREKNRGKKDGKNHFKCPAEKVRHLLSQMYLRLHTLYIF